MVTYFSSCIKYLSLVLGFAPLSFTSLEAHKISTSLDLEGANLIGPKNFKRMKQPKYDWTQKEPKDFSDISTKTLSSPKIINTLLTPQK